MLTMMNHVSFTVSNLAKSVEFYQEVLGLEMVSLAERDEMFSSSVTGIVGAKLNIAYMKALNCSIELIEYTGTTGIRIDTPTNNIGSEQVCFNVKDFDKWIEHLKRHNVKFRGTICRVPAGPNKGKQVVYAIDNDGNNLEFLEG